MTTETQQTPTAEAAGYTPEEQKIIQSLSGEEYYWRSLKRISEVTGLQTDALDAAMT